MLKMLVFEHFQHEFHTLKCEIHTLRAWAQGRFRAFLARDQSRTVRLAHRLVLCLKCAFMRILST